MKHIVVTKQVKHLAVKGHHKKTHPEFPLEIEEFDSLDDALKKHPGKYVMSVDEYLGFKHAMNVVHGEIKSLKKRWWQFWKGL